MINGKSGAARAGAAELTPTGSLRRDYLAEYIWQQQFAQAPIGFPGQVEAQQGLAAYYRQMQMLGAFWGLGWGNGRTQVVPTVRGMAAWSGMEARATDEDLTSALGAALESHPATIFAEIQVAAKGQVVTLRGLAPNRYAKRVADALAWSLPGVRDVMNQIEVRSRAR
jgi:osmotically-inducible protein OsmY